MIEEFSQKSIVIPALKKRQEVIFNNKLIDDKTFMFLLVLTAGNIGNSLMYLYYLQWYCATNNIKEYSFENNFINIFPMGFFKEETLNHYWDVTKVRTDKRIDFIGGIRGLAELENRVNSGDMAVAFSLHPVSVQQLFDIADSGNVMPPKSTWFEPKLRDGLLTHLIV